MIKKCCIIEKLKLFTDTAKKVLFVDHFLFVIKTNVLVTTIWTDIYCKDEQVDKNS